MKLRIENEQGRINIIRKKMIWKNHQNWKDYNKANQEKESRVKSIKK